MAEYIEREAFIKILNKTKDECEHYADKVVCDFAIRMANLMPTADVQEVIRCKDCVFYVAEYCTRDIKERTNMFYMTADDFCSYGERKCGDDNV